MDETASAPASPPLLGRLSYGAKLFGTAVVLIGITVAVTSISMILADRIESRLAVLAGLYAPLTDELGEIEAEALRQEVVFERALVVREMGDGPRLAVERAEFDQLGERIDTHLASATERVTKAEQAHTDAVVQTVLDGLAPALRRIDAEHHQWEGHARAVLSAPERPAEADILRVEREGDEYTRALDTLRARMGQVTRSAAAEARQDELALQRIDLVLTAVAVVLGLVLAALLTAGLVRPVRRLLEAMLRVRSGELATKVETASSDEVGQLAAGFNEMVDGLLQKERLRETFGRFVDPRIVRDLIDNPDLALDVGQRRTMSVLFSDIVGFSGLSERLEPGALVMALNAWFDTMSQPIHDERGVIDKYIGDAILAWWGQPFVPQAEAALRACRAALAKRNLLGRFNAELPELLGGDGPQLDLRIGVSTGPCVVGTIGSSRARDYTVIGDTVNAGARLEAACKMYGVRILVDEATALAVGGEIALREVDTVNLAGKSAASRIFELLDPVEWIDARRTLLAEQYALGLESYRAGQWADARTRFERCLEIEPTDGPSRTLLARLDGLEDAPPAEWTGVWTQTK